MMKQGAPFSKNLFENFSKNKDFPLANPTGCNTNNG
jgi:hypothetical protein